MDTDQPAPAPDGGREPRTWRAFLASIDPGDGWLWTWVLTLLVLGVGLGTYQIWRVVCPPSREWAKVVSPYVAALAGHSDTRAQQAAHMAMLVAAGTLILFRWLVGPRMALRLRPRPRVLLFAVLGCLLAGYFVLSARFFWQQTRGCLAIGVCGALSGM